MATATSVFMVLTFGNERQSERIAHLGTADCCIHPPGRKRDDRDHAADNFFQGGSPKTGHPTYRARTSSPPEIVSDQISGDGAWMNFRFSRALPPGGSHTSALDDLKAFPSGLGHAVSGTTYLPTR